MSALTLTRVLRKEVETKYGIKPQIVIQTTQHGDKWLSSFKVMGTDGWSEGDTVEVDLQEKGDFINFTPRGTGPAKVSDVLSPEYKERIERLEKAVFGSQEAKKDSKPAEEVIQADDLPDFGEPEEEGDGF